MISPALSGWAYYAWLGVWLAVLGGIAYAGWRHAPGLVLALLAIMTAAAGIVCWHRARWGRRDLPRLLALPRQACTYRLHRGDDLHRGEYGWAAFTVEGAEAWWEAEIPLTEPWPYDGSAQRGEVVFAGAKPRLLIGADGQAARIGTILRMPGAA